MRLSCNFVNVYTIAAYRVGLQYTFTRVHAGIPNGQPREDPREVKRATRGRVGGQVGEDVHVGVGVGPIEFNLYRPSPFSFSKSSLNGIQL